MRHENGWIPPTEIPPPPPPLIFNDQIRQLARNNGWIPHAEIPPPPPAVFDRQAQQLATANGWILKPTIHNGIWDANLAQVANHHGLHANINEVPALPAGAPIQFPQVMVRPYPRTAAQEKAYLKKGCHLCHNANQKPPGRAKIQGSNYGRDVVDGVNWSSYVRERRNVSCPKLGFGISKIIRVQN